jgi:hypothetical protein
MKYFLLICSTVALLITTTASVLAQPSIPQGRLGASVDLTGTWVSIITEDWQWRMVTPQIGDFSSIPENDAAKAIAMEWRPEQDVGNECRAYGAATIMSEPSRLRISWVDDMTLLMEVDSGMQNRTFHFNEADSSGAPSRQGFTVASWERNAPPRGRVRAPATRNPAFIIDASAPKTLEAHTNNLIPGYLRKNGIPHSDQATVTEYINVIEIADGTTWLIDTVIVEDPIFLSQPYVISRNFKKEDDDSKWNPQGCW